MVCAKGFAIQHVIESPVLMIKVGNLKSYLYISIKTYVAVTMRRFF